jgi:hypothetical protein
MKKLTIILVAMTVLVTMASLGNAALMLGDEVTLSHRWPEADSVWKEIVVPVGNSATFSFHDGNFNYIVDVKPDGLFISFPDLGLFGASEFTGLMVEGIATNVVPQIATDFAGWDSSRIIIGADSLAFNWSGLYTGASLGGGTYFNVEAPAAHTPEPATMLLLGSGLVGLAGFGRKKFKG